MSWLFSGGVRMIPGKMGRSSAGEAEQVTVFRYWVGMSDFSGEIRKKLEVPVLCCSHTEALCNVWIWFLHKPKLPNHKMKHLLCVFCFFKPILAQNNFCSELTYPINTINQPLPAVWLCLSVRVKMCSEQGRDLHWLQSELV